MHKTRKFTIGARIGKRCTRNPVRRSRLAVSSKTFLMGAPLPL